ncbi:phage minor tail protein L [uncultured Psychrobacter sp.]|uniref:phage minor tail protein L n=1 Tax=uncultured Psychrobacter sp. TaxID=259303 RepID=UPI002591C0AE|nr:phage minor tail protein L [uncultured Psychrobacter sp.]
MSLSSDFQKLSVAGLVTLYELDASKLGLGVLRWHGHLSYEDWEYIYEFANRAQFANKSKRVAATGADDIVVPDIIWNGNEYKPVAIQSDGLEIRGDGKASTPSLVITSDLNGVKGMTRRLCRQYNDFAGAKLTVIRTSAKYLDAANFADGNPTANVNEYRKQVWYIEHKVNDDEEKVTFELSNPVDFEGARIPAREITSFCHWGVTGGYRGECCQYMGTAMFDENGNPTNNRALDKCGCRITDCQIRNNVERFGGYPSSSLI